MQNSSFIYTFLLSRKHEIKPDMTLSVDSSRLATYPDNCWTGGLPHPHWHHRGTHSALS